jgi:hypothetical protein
VVQVDDNYVRFSGRADRRRRLPPPPYPSVGWSFETDTMLGRLTRLNLTVPTGGGGNATAGVVLDHPMGLFDLLIGAVDHQSANRGTRHVVSHRADESTVSLSIRPTSHDEAPIQGVDIELRLSPWQPPWRRIEVELRSTSNTGYRPLHAVGQLLMLPPGLHRANHRVPRRLPFTPTWLPDDFDPVLRPGPSGLGFPTAVGHWASHDGGAPLDLYTNVVGVGPGETIDRLEHPYLGLIAIVTSAIAPEHPFARFHLERPSFCGYAIEANGVTTDDLARTIQQIDASRPRSSQVL